MKLFLSVALAVVAASQPIAIIAQTAERRTTYAIQPDSPIKITQARVRIYDWHGGTQLNLCVNHDEPSTAVSAVRYVVRGVSAFRETTRSVAITDDDRPTTGTLTDPEISGTKPPRYHDDTFVHCFTIYPNPVPRETERYLVYVDAVSLADGSIWKPSPNSNVHRNPPN